MWVYVWVYVWVVGLGDLSEWYEGAVASDVLPALLGFEGTHQGAPLW